MSKVFADCQQDFELQREATKRTTPAGYTHTGTHARAEWQTESDSCKIKETFCADWQAENSRSVF